MGKSVSWYLLVLDMRGEVVAAHELYRGKGRTITNKEHYEGLRRAAPRSRVLMGKAFLDRFAEPGKLPGEALRTIEDEPIRDRS
ncbi:MAG TPA: hypothetical protein GXX30_09050 [Firmicutes bacterium]|nr:hypothetical protein [Candidatus Fermentithermobacillaceae bacterium]